MSKKNSFYNVEIIGGILLFFTALLGMLIANSPLRLSYEHFLELDVVVSVGNLILKKPLILWINDGLMAIYFLLIGLEIKREAKRGLLSSKSALMVPAITAMGGLIIPALIFLLFNFNHPEYLKGWAIPTATDIAFTLSIVSLLGSRFPLSLKILLTAVAIFDDIAAIAIIALFYTQKLSVFSFAMASVFTLMLIGLNIFKCRRISLYMLLGVGLWVAVLKSGVHATLAGIVLAMTIPDEGSKKSMLTRLEKGLHYWVVFLILPLFAFANAGVNFIGIDTSMLYHPIVLGIALGLFIGKQLGIFLPLAYFVKFRRLFKSDNINLRHIYGFACICGVGFTMSLFIGSLAYVNATVNLMPMVKIGVVFGSLVAGVTGFFILRNA